MYYPQQMNQYCGNPYMQVQAGLKGRPVTSIEEVKAANVDFDGSLFIFPDVANGKIYTKKISLDGTAELNVYELGKIPSISDNNFITRDEFEAFKSSLTPVKEPKKANPPINF